MNHFASLVAVLISIIPAASYADEAPSLAMTISKPADTTVSTAVLQGHWIYTTERSEAGKLVAKSLPVEITFDLTAIASIQGVAVNAPPGEVASKISIPVHRIAEDPEMPAKEQKYLKLILEQASSEADREYADSTLVAQLENVVLSSDSISFTLYYPGIDGRVTHQFTRSQQQ